MESWGAGGWRACRGARTRGGAGRFPAALVTPPGARCPSSCAPGCPRFGSGTGSRPQRPSADPSARPVRGRLAPHPHVAPRESVCSAARWLEPEPQHPASWGDPAGANTTGVSRAPPAHLDLLVLVERTLRSTGRSFPHVPRRRRGSCCGASSAPHRGPACARARTGRGATRQVTWVPRPCLQLPGQHRRHVLATGVPRKRLSDAGSARGHWGPLRGDADGRVGARALARPHRGPGRHHGGCRRPLREGSGRQAASSATCRRPTPVGAAVTDVSVRKPAARVRPRAALQTGPAGSDSARHRLVTRSRRRERGRSSPWAARP